MLVIYRKKNSTYFKRRTIRYPGRGGGPSTSERKQSFFWRSTYDIFFLCFVVCFPFYVGYHLVFFLVNIFFINFDNNFFLCPHFQQFLWRLAPPPPPQISNCASLSNSLSVYAFIIRYTNLSAAQCIIRMYEESITKGGLTVDFLLK